MSQLIAICALISAMLAAASVLMQTAQERSAQAGRNKTRTSPLARPWAGAARQGV